MMLFKGWEVNEKVIALVFGIALILAIIVGFVGYRNPDSTWKIEVFKFTLQFLLIVVLGGGVTLLFSRYIKKCELKDTQLAEERERRDIEREAYRQIHGELIREYNSAKRIRRILLAEAIAATDEGDVIKVEPYREQIRAIINVQLRFEYLKRFFEDDELLKNSIQPYIISIESYINNIILEYQKL